jgi:hypothetical protein
MVDLLGLLRRILPKPVSDPNVSSGDTDIHNDLPALMHGCPVLS